MTTAGTIILGLDISTSVVGVCLLDASTGVLVDLQPIKLTSSKLLTMWDKADAAIAGIKSIVGQHTVMKVYVEANAKMFSVGFSSADTLMTLAKFNGIVSYLSHKAFAAPIVDVNVSSARKAVGFKNTKTDKRPVKDKVFEFVTTLHPEFPWKKHVAKTGKSQGQEVFDAEMKDCSDAWVIAAGGKNLCL